jgi:hypothetical protein
MRNGRILLDDTEIPISLEKFDFIYVCDNVHSKNGRVALAKYHTVYGQTPLEISQEPPTDT